MTDFLIAHTNGNGAQAWRQETVRAFFEAIPWDGRLLGSVITQSNSSGQSPMTMTVQEFFALIPWEGQPAIAAPISPIEVQPEEPPSSSDPSLTLDAFSDLF
jgi:hypothetical protein